MEKYWCAFAKLTKTGSVFVNLLYKYFGSIELAWHAEICDLYKIPGLRKNQISCFIEERNKIKREEI